MHGFLESSSFNNSGNGWGFHILVIEADPLPIVSKYGDNEEILGSRIVKPFDNDEQTLESQIFEMAVIEDYDPFEMEKQKKLEAERIRQEEQREAFEKEEKVNAFILYSQLDPLKVSAKIKKRIQASLNLHAAPTSSDEQGVILKRRSDENGVSIEENNDNSYALIHYPLGHGAYKQVKLVAKIGNHELFARATGPLNAATMSPEKLEISLNKIAQELEMQRLFDHDDEFVKVVYGHKFLSKKSGLEKYAILMEYCPDGDFEHFIKASKGIPPEVKNTKLISYFFDLFSGLKKMEERHILHRDLKPANILLIGDHAKITDFGFSVTEEQQKASFLANPKECPGTPLYCSPEYIVRSNYIQPQLDLINQKAEKAKTDYSEFKKDYNALKINEAKETIKEKIEEIRLAKRLTRGNLRSLQGEIKDYKILTDRFKNMLEFRDQNNPKSDLWTMGLILYEALYEIPLYKQLNRGNSFNFNQLMEFLFLLTQEQLDQACTIAMPENSFEFKMHEVMKKILVLDPRNRPSAKELLEFYSDIFKEELVK